MFDKIIERLTVDNLPSPLISAKRNEEEEQHRKRGLKLSIIIHLFLLIILIFPFISALPPIGQEGIVINFGHTDTGQGDEQPLTEDATPDASSEPSAPSEPIADASTASNNPTPPTPQRRETPKPVTKKEVVTDANADTPSVKKDDKKAKEDAAKKAEAEAEQRKKDEAERQQKEEQKKKVEAEAKRKAEEEAKRKAEEEARKKEEAKKKFGFPGQNNSTGQGDNGDTGNQGTTDGDPNSENLDTRQSGKGEAGEGVDLAGRTVQERPDIKNETNNTGDVKVKICVDLSGNVTKAEYLIEGSSTQNSYLVKLAETKAKEFKFKSILNGKEEQCGSILFTFTVE